MRKAFFLLLILLVSNCIDAATVSLSGTALSYSGSRLAVFGIADYISNKRTLLQTAEIDSDGQFSLSFDVTETQSVIVHINRTEAVLYVEPGKSYLVDFPSVVSAEIRRFDRTSVELSFTGAADDDINLLIRDFNDDFINFVSTHYYDFAVGEYRGSDAYLKKLGENIKVADIYKGAETNDTLKSKIIPVFSGIVRDFIAKTETKYERQLENTFFRDYVEYSLAELELISGMSRNEFYGRHFMSRMLPLRNPAFMNCFAIFYANFLVNHESGLQSSITKSINIERDPNRLVELFSGDSSALSIHIRTLAVINGLKEVYHNKSYNRAAIEKTLSFIKSDLPEIETIAANTLSQLRKSRENWLLEDFSLLDERDERWLLSEHLDRPVYLLFFASWNAGSCKEMQVLQKLNEKYGRDVLFVGICMDDQYSQYKKYLTEHRDQKFEILFGNSDPLLSEKCNVRSIPHAIMLDAEGRTLYAYTRKPSEGIQVDIEKIVSANATPGGIKTWKD